MWPACKVRLRLDSGRQFNRGSMMNSLVAAAASAALFLAAPAIATTYSGTGSLDTVEAPSGYNVADPVTWSFTTGGSIATPNGPGFALTAFSLSVGSQSWTLADFVDVGLGSPFALPMAGTLEVFFTGLNSSNSLVSTGLNAINPWSGEPPTFFLLNQLGGGTAATAGQAAGTLGGPSVAAVPEPASWAMLIAGFGLTGAVARRRRALAA